jgi:hypothetical protein
VILNVKFKLFSFDTEKLEAGQSAYPFSLTLPDWLPESVMLKDGLTILSVTYFLTAQIDPRVEAQ